MFHFKKEELQQEGKEKEWISANGLGGYASSTLVGLNTRKYHGLLISTLPSQQKYLQLAKIDEELQFEKNHYSLGTTHYEHTLHPEGHKHLSHFTKHSFSKYYYN